MYFCKGGKCLRNRLGFVLEHRGGYLALGVLQDPERGYNEAAQRKRIPIEPTITLKWAKYLLSEEGIGQG